MNQQLSEIKEWVQKAETATWKSSYFDDGTPYMSIMGTDCVTVAENCIEWLASLVAEVERLNYIIAVMEADSNNVYAGCGKFHRENKEMQKTLEFYADESTYDIDHLSKHGYIIIDKDGGERARQTLQSLKGDKP